MKCIFLKGWINPLTMFTPGWITTWYKSAVDAEKEGFELVVFKIPEKHSSVLITVIEDFLQEEVKKLS